jgi:hypothetical protein
MTNFQFPVPDRGPGLRRALPAVVLCALALALVLACDEGIDEYKPEPNVYCTIRTDRDTLSLMAGMTLGYFDSIPDSNRWNGTAGVVATVTHRDSETTLVELPGPVGFYRAEPVSIVPGDSYQLLVTYPDGAVVRGSTTVPDTFSLYELRFDSTFYEPWPGETAWTQRVSFKWGESRGASEYLEESEAWYKAGSDSTSVSYSAPNLPGRHDTLYVSPFTYEYDTLTQTYDSLPLDRVRLAIRAVDRNYHDYTMLGWWQGGRELMHLDGGVGVFGSACVAETTFRFQPGR